MLLLLNVAQLEYVLKNMFQKILNAKDDSWNECKDQGAERMTELGEFASLSPSLLCPVLLTLIGMVQSRRLLFRR